MKRWLLWTGGAVAALLTVVLVARLLNPLPSLAGREVTRAIGPVHGRLIGSAVRQGLERSPGHSGLRLLPDGREAFATRMLLARAAERSIDAQYYIWHDDLTGGLLFDELRAAADRGVRVRLLLDDNNTAGLDPLLARLNAHPNLELRLFNPFTIRSPRLLGWVADFGRLNRRMHNKSLTFDNEVTVIGGRNIGDEYFGAGGGALFVDLDTRPRSKVRICPKAA
jgi:putative cardiolipin synthase